MPHLRVDDLQAAAATLRRVQATAEAEAKKYRQETRRATDDLNQLRADLAAAEQTVLAAEQARVNARDAVSAAQVTLDQARAARAARLQAEADQHLLEELKTAAQTLLAAANASPATPISDGPTPDQARSPTVAAGADSDSVSLAEFRRRLSDAETAATRAADHHRAELALVGVQLTAAHTSVVQLHDAGAECPVCRRDLAPEDIIA